MRFLIVALLAGLVLGTVYADPVPKEKVKTNAEKVVGKWRIVKSDGTEVNGMTVEFTDKGKMTISVDDGKSVIQGTYKVTKEGIDYTIETDDEKQTEVLKIKKLDDEKMTTEDPMGKIEEFERIVDKKKDEKKEEKKEEKKPDNK